MILILKENTSFNEVKQLINKLEWMSLQAVLTEENGQYYLAVVNNLDESINLEMFLKIPCIEKVIPFTQKFKLAGKEFKKERTVVQIQGQEIGGGKLSVMAGPCSIESEEQIHLTASLVAKAGATILRGGAFKPRTSPYDFQGLGEQGLIYMQSAAKKNGLLCVSEIMDTRDVELVANHVDILQIGARNMQNFSLLKEVGKSNKPVLLKRGFAATYQDLLMAAEYILSGGNLNVMLCERGIRTFETYSRNTLDIAAVPILHELSHLPVFIDPSHGTGIRKMVAPMARAAVAAGADGLIMEVHPNPDKSLSDAMQTISPAHLAEIMESLRLIGPAVGIKVD